jgi:hypothetical protein
VSGPFRKSAMRLLTLQACSRHGTTADQGAAHPVQANIWVRPWDARSRRGGPHAEEVERKSGGVSARGVAHPEGSGLSWEPRDGCSDSVAVMVGELCWV